MGITATMDTSKLAQSASALVGFLVGRGAGEGEVQQALRTETGQLAKRMGDSVKPGVSSAKRVNSDIKKHLAFLPAGGDLLMQEGEKFADFTWLFAGSNFIAGINDEDNHLKASAESAYEMMRVGQHSEPRSKTQYVEVGVRKFGAKSRGYGQKIMRLDRLLVTQSTFNKVRAKVSAKLGELSAACYNVAKQYVPSINVPEKFAKKIPAAIAKNKSSSRETGMETASAAIEFSIRSAGVVSNDRLNVKFQGAIKGAQISLAAKAAKIAKGAKYVFETGQVFFDRHGNEYTPH